MSQHRGANCEPTEMSLITLALRYIVPAFINAEQFDELKGEFLFRNKLNFLC